MYRVLFLFTLLLLLFVYGCPYPPPRISERGTIEQKQSTDSSLIEYDLTIKPLYCIVDTSILELYDADSNLICDTALYADELDTTAYYIIMQLPINLKGDVSLEENVEVASLNLKHHLYSKRYSYYPDNYINHFYWLNSKNNDGCIIGLGLPSFDKSSHPAEVREVDEKHIFSYHFGYIKRYNKLILDARTNFYSARLSANDKKYLFEILDLGIKYLPRNKFDWTPIPVLRANISKYKIVYGFNRFREYSAGVGVGLSIEKKFQRFTYTYNTSYGGYHKFDALFSYVSDYDTKLGSQYTFYHGKNLKMFSFSYVFEFYNKDHIKYPNDQNFIHKTLSAGPLFPFYWLSVIVKETSSSD